MMTKTEYEEIVANSPLYAHAKRELEFAGYNNKNPNSPGSWIYDAVLESVAVFCSHYNSGASAPIEIELVRKLCSWENLVPLTFNDDEWRGGLTDDIDGSKQNIRCSNFFKYKDGRITNINAFSCMPTRTYYINDSGKYSVEDKENPICWHGGLYEVNEDGSFTGRYLNRTWLKKNDVDSHNYNPKKTIYIKCTEYELAKDDWIFYVPRNSEDLKKLKELYDCDFVVLDEIKGKYITEITPKEIDAAWETFKNGN